MTSPADHAAMRRQFKSDLALICERMGYSDKERKFLQSCYEGDFRAERNYRHVAALMEREMVSNTNKCVWSEDSDGTWQTSCEQAFCLNDGSPSDNDMKYCCYCGKALAECKYVEEEYGR